jgi:hypothetical protein
MRTNKKPHVNLREFFCFKGGELNGGSKHLFVGWKEG